MVINPAADKICHAWECIFALILTSAEDSEENESETTAKKNLWESSMGSSKTGIFFHTEKQE